MKSIKLFSFAKINLSIDVKGIGSEGFHEVDMIMQQLSFHDDVAVAYEPYGEPERAADGAPGAAPEAPGADGKDCKETDLTTSGSFDIKVKTNRYYLPVDERNLAYRAAALIAERYGGAVRPGRIKIDIGKRIPVAGGLAGGSGNGAAVIHALNILWELGLSLGEIMDLSGELGSDVPFCAMGQAKCNAAVPEEVRQDAMASSCARARGRGSDLTPLTPFRSWIVIAKPRFSVSTKEVYDGIDRVKIGERPDNDRLEQALSEGPSGANASGIYRDFVNVLECYTLQAYPEVAELKEFMKKCGAVKALMSGSGPTVFGVFRDIKGAKSASARLRKKGFEAYWTKTIR